MPAAPASISESTELAGRIEARDKVIIHARVTAYLNEQLFVDGADVKKGQLLYRLEQGPFQAEVDAKKAGVAQAEAQLENANLALQRAQQLLEKSAGSQSVADNARAEQLSAKAQVQLTKAQLQAAEINLAYTEIRSPIDGRISRSLVTPGNVVGPATGAGLGLLTTVVSQDPMNVVFPIPVRTLQDLHNNSAKHGKAFPTQIRLRLPNGQIYDQVGKLDFMDNLVAQDTDTVLLRGIVTNPVITPAEGGNGQFRHLVHGEYVTVLIESGEPTPALSIPRSSVLTDQKGDYVYVVGADNKVEQRRVKLGQSTPLLAMIVEGVKEGENVVSEGLQRVTRPGIEVKPQPAAAPANRN